MASKELYEVLYKFESESDNILDKLMLCSESPEFVQEENSKIFDLLKKISSLGEKFEKGNPKFSPEIEISDEDLKLLSELDLYKLPVRLAVRVADLLWLKKKDTKAAYFSIEAYYNLYLSTFDYNDWVDCIEHVKRAVTLSQKLNDNTHRNQYLQNLFERLVKNGGNDKFFFSIAAADFLIEQAWDDLGSILPVMDNIIAKPCTSFGVLKHERAFGIKREIYKKQKNTELVNATDCEHAEFLERMSIESANNGFQGLMQAAKYLADAVNLYRNGKNEIAAEAAHKNLLDIQARIPNEVPKYVHKFDVSEYYNHTEEAFEGLTFEEHIVQIAMICHIFSKEELRNSVYDPERFFTKRLFGVEMVDKKGRTINRIPALNDSSSISDEEEQMHFEALRKEEILGKTALVWAVQLLNKRFNFSEDDLEFIVKDNCIIPEGREKIFQKAMYWGLKGDLYSALHILTPQMENLFRNIASMLGSNMSTINPQGIAADKVLLSVFADPLLNEGYDEDILFIFKGLMNEKSGANLRNKFAHGIIDEDECYSGSAMYFLCATLKLLLLTSHPAYEIIRKLSGKHNLLDDNEETPEKQ